MASIFEKMFGSHSKRELKRIDQIVEQIEALAPEYKELTDEQLKGKTDHFKERLSSGETLDDILPEAFATVREAATRVIGQTHFKVQLIGGIVLHQGRIAEMKTGEGKTLTASLPAYLNALTGEGVHIVTVNDYLAKYQGEWMGKIYGFLGMKVGVIIHDMDPVAKKAAYDADITYGTNNEYGFDYLRDNMAIYKDNMFQRGHVFAIVDEVDSILIDEARTPLIISGQGEKSTPLYEICDNFAKSLRVFRIKELDEKEHSDDIDADYVVDEKARTTVLTARGVEKAEKFFNLENLADYENTTIQHHINQAIKARGIMQRDIDYVVNEEGKVIIVDEFTGRLMQGRRYSDGLHQAIEAKEKVMVENENKTLATITLQNYFRMYRKLSGMTGTAQTEEAEFREIYKLDVIEIPTNRPMIREDNPDSVYKTEAGKLRAIVAHIQKCHEIGQPVLVGTVSIEKSEVLSSMLSKAGIKHSVLNAKHHEKEADIVALAGRFGAITIATNMAGRGTDIMLGGNPEIMARQALKKEGMEEELVLEAIAYNDTKDPAVLEARAEFRQHLERFKQETKAEYEKVVQAGGLCIVGTERHESRRIDNQLRGRAGRQGDPGASKFYLSLQDDLMRLFGSDRITGLMDTLGFDEDTPIDQRMLSNAIESAQKKVESRNFQIRKHVLEYDNVMNHMREVIYGQRKKVLDGEDMKAYIEKMIQDHIDMTVHAAAGEQNAADEEQAGELVKSFVGMFIAPEQETEFLEKIAGMDTQSINEALTQQAMQVYEAREQDFTPQVMREVERVVLLRNVDGKWMDHIDAMHELRQGVSMRGYGQQDPVMAYKQEGFDMFEEMINSIKADTVKTIYKVEVNRPESTRREQVAKPIIASQGDQTLKKAPRKVTEKVGRNDTCPCGSGKKYKKCCGLNQ